LKVTKNGGTQQKANIEVLFCCEKCQPWDQNVFSQDNEASLLQDQWVSMEDVHFQCTSTSFVNKPPLAITTGQPRRTISQNKFTVFTVSLTVRLSTAVYSKGYQQRAGSSTAVRVLSVGNDLGEYYLCINLCLYPFGQFPSKSLCERVV
jgi:hypothetical protein